MDAAEAHSQQDKQTGAELQFMSHLRGSSGTAQVVKVKHLLKYFAEMKLICASKRLLPRWRTGRLPSGVSLSIYKRDSFKTELKDASLR